MIKFLLFLLVSFSAFADDSPLAIVVAYGPGGATDFQARIVTMPSEHYLKRPAYILNKPGAGGRIGWTWFEEMGASRASDVVAVYNAPHFIAQSIAYPEVAYGVDSFKPVANWGEDPAVLVVSSSGETRSIRSILDSSQRVTFSGAGMYVGHHIAFLQAFGDNDKAVYVPHPRGGAGALKAVISAEVMAGFNNLSDSIRAAREGSVEILAIARTERHPLLPDVPTFAELGFLGVDNTSVNYRGIMVKDTVSDSVVRDLSAKFVQMFNDSKVKSRMEASGSPMLVLNSDETSQLWRSQKANLDKVSELFN